MHVHGVLGESSPQTETLNELYRRLRNLLHKKLNLVLTLFTRDLAICLVL